MALRSAIYIKFGNSPRIWFWLKCYRWQSSRIARFREVSVPTLLEVASIKLFPIQVIDLRMRSMIKENWSRFWGNLEERFGQVELKWTAFDWNLSAASPHNQSEISNLNCFWNLNVYIFFVMVDNKEVVCKNLFAGTISSESSWARREQEVLSLKLTY